MSVITTIAKISGGDVATLGTNDQLGQNNGGTGSNMSATGGTNHLVRQNSVGGAFTTGVLSAGEMPTGIDAANIADGSVSNLEFQQLSDIGTSQTIQTQLDNKQPLSVALQEIAALTLTEGDLFTVDGSGSIVNVGIGTLGQVPTSDGTTWSWETPVSSPASTLNGTNDNAGTVVRGQAVYIKSDGDFDLARANNLATSDVVGFVQNASVAAAGTITAQLDGTFTATTGEWDAVAGTTGGLTPGTIYYLSSATPGMLTSTPPSASGTQVAAKRFLAKSSTVAVILERSRLINT